MRQAYEDNNQFLQYKHEAQAGELSCANGSLAGASLYLVQFGFRLSRTTEFEWQTPSTKT